jgi:cell division protein FtsZ
MGNSLSLTLVSALPEDALTSPRKTPSLTASTSPAATLSPIPASEPPAAAPEVIATEITPLPTAVEPEAPSLFEMAAPLPPEPEEELIDESLLLEEAIPALAIGEFTAIKTVEISEPDLETAPADADEDFPEMPELPDLRLEPAADAPQPLPWSAIPSPKETFADASPAPASEPEAPKLKLGIKSGSPQSELSLDSSPRGRFEGEKPNVFEGEDLDLPPFLRKKK